MDEQATARIAALEAQVAELRELLRSRTPTQAPTELAEQPDERPDRRALLRRAGAVALTAVGAAAVTARPAAAADGDAFKLGVVGSTNTNSSRTMATYTGTVSGAAYLFQQGSNYSPSDSAVPVALAGWATSVGAAGIYGYAPAGVGVYAVGYGSAPGQGIGLVATGGKANIRVAPSGSAPSGRVDAHEVGELVADAAGGLWYCVTAGTPGSWRRVSGPGAAGSLHVLAAPVRAYDSRPDHGASAPKGKLVAGMERAIDLTFGGAIPVGANAALLNVTVTNTEANGNLAVYSNAVAYPGTSTLNWPAGATVANSAVVAVDANARIKVRASSAAHVLIDATGYYV